MPLLPNIYYRCLSGRDMNTMLVAFRIYAKTNSNNKPSFENKKNEYTKTEISIFNNFHAAFDLEYRKIGSLIWKMFYNFIFWHKMTPKTIIGLAIEMEEWENWANNDFQFNEERILTQSIWWFYIIKSADFVRVEFQSVINRSAQSKSEGERCIWNVKRVFSSISLLIGTPLHGITKSEHTHKF